MGYRHHLQKQSSQKSAFTPRTNPFEPRPFANGVKARSAELPKTDLLQTRPFAPPIQPQHEIPDLQTQREITEPVGHSLEKIRIHAPSAPPPPPPVQREGGLGGWHLQPIQRAAPVINWLSLSREDKFGQQETVQEKEVGAEISIQRLCDECESELADQEDKQPVQAKLTMGEPGDKYEQEADAVARQVVDKINSPQPQQSVQRQSDKEGASELGLTLMRHSEGGFGEGVSVTQDVEQGIQQARGGGHNLDHTVRESMEQGFGADFSGVRVHTDAQSDQLNRSIHAQAFTTGQDIFFKQGKYNPGSRGGQELLAHELTHVVQQNGDAVASRKVIQRKEVKKDSEIQGKQDWTTADRLNNTQRWKDACLTNLKAVDSSQYVKVIERRDFYKWFYEYSASLGYTTRWALAAYVVANGAHQIADMDVDHAIANDTLSLANVELQGVMREGNQVIFDNVLPKLKKLIDGGPMTGKAALNWDMQVLAEEQTLIQPMYSRMSKETVEQLDYIARKKRLAGIGAALRWPWNDRDDFVPKGPYNKEGIVPEFDQPNIQNIGDRWKYGMKLGNMFTPGGSGFDPNKHTMPAVGIGYQDGSEFAKVDTRANLHKLDAWLNPNRFSRVGSGSDIQAIINSLSPFEKQQVLSDRSPDGWAYSLQFAQFSFITEAMVKQALPSEASFASAVAAFLARYKAERTKVQMRYPTHTYYPVGF